MLDAARPTLGSLMSLTCFHYLRQGAEDTAGRALVVAAGRQRGYELIESMGLCGTSQEPEVMRLKLDAALGEQGTRLCLVQRIRAKPNGGYEVQIGEGACTAGVQSDTPYCAFTLGVFIGALAAITGQRMIGRETQCAAMGGPICVYQIDPVS
jgi:predicted hydrocarbon binding protein